MNPVMTYRRTRRRTNQLILLILLLLAMISAAIIFLTFYGLNTGNFIIGIEQDAYNKNISIAETPDATDNQKTLFIQTMPIYPFDFAIIHANLDQFTEVDGVVEEFKRNSVAVTFYIKNELSNLSYDLNYYINLKEVRHDSNELQNVKILMVVDGEKRLYHKEEYNLVNYGSDYIVTNFREGSRIVTGKINELEAGGVKKITIILWYEGRQIDEEDVLEALKLQVVFEIDEPGEGV